MNSMLFEPIFGVLFPLNMECDKGSSMVKFNACKIWINHLEMIAGDFVT